MPNTNDRIIAAGPDVTNNMIISTGNGLSVTSVAQTGAIKISGSGLAGFTVPGVGVEFINPTINSSIGLHGVGTIGVLLMQTKNVASGNSATFLGSSSGSARMQVQTVNGITSYSASSGLLSMGVDGINAIAISKIGTSQLITRFYSSGTAAPNETHEIQLYGINSGYVGLKAPDAVTTSVTFTLPAVDGAAGNTLTTDGAGNLSWVGGGAVNPLVHTSSYATPYDTIEFVDTTTVPINVIPPAGPSVVTGTRVHIIDVGGNVIANNVTFQPTTSGYNFYGAAVDDVITVNHFSIRYIYVNATVGWVREIG